MSGESLNTELDEVTEKPDKKVTAPITFFCKLVNLTAIDQPAGRKKAYEATLEVQKSGTYVF